MVKQLTFEADAKESILRGVSKLAKAVTSTLGPRGHNAVLDKGWGGWYPSLGQLERCAKGYFDLVDEVDGTEDYYLTSMAWKRLMMRRLMTPSGMFNLVRSIPSLLRFPRELLTVLLAPVLSGTWGWQFEQPDPPTRLLRQVWEYRDRA